MSSPGPSADERDDLPATPSLSNTGIFDEDWDEEADDDDIDFDPTGEESEDIEYFDVEDEEDEEMDEDQAGDGDFHDAPEGAGGLEIEVSIDPHAEANGAGTIGSVRVVQAAGATAPVQVSRAQILQLLGHAGLRRILAQHNAGGYLLDDNDDEHMPSRRTRRTRKREPPQLEPVPSPAGKELMDSGTFGSNELYEDKLRKRKSRMSWRLMSRELGTDRSHTIRENKIISQGLIPSSKADMIVHYNSRCYSGQFSDDGNFFFSCAQDFNVRMYDTSNPYDWKYYKKVLYPFGQWTITDATLSPENKFLAYSSIRSNVCLASTDPNDDSEPRMLDFSNSGTGTRTQTMGWGGAHFGIWSIRFSGDGRELVAGTSDHSVYVFDLEMNKAILRIHGHSEDVNAVCFGDTSSPHILYSGSDDTLIKVWDRRSMGDSREAGVFMGHTEGLTYVDSKGDGRYVLSNGKDQTMKLWDLRKMMATDKSSTINPQRYSMSFDYRFMDYDVNDWAPHPHDCSLVTFRGHSVLKTLIRCHFGPPGSTNSRYVYSGSENGKVYIYNLDATLAGTVDVNAATRNTRPRDPHYYNQGYEMDDGGTRGAWKTCVRDASWHPNAPVIAATSWNGWGMSTGTCTVHTWNDGADEDESGIQTGRRVDHELKDNRGLLTNSGARGAGDGGGNRRVSSRRSRLRSRFIGRAEDEVDEEAETW